MVTFLRNPVNIGGKQVVEVACLSTDTKPTKGICNGSLCLEINTGKIFAYDEENGEWEEVGTSGGGGGGGGSSDFDTATMTVTGFNGFLDAFGIYAACYVDPTDDAFLIAVESTGLSNGEYLLPMYKGAGWFVPTSGTGYIISGNASYDSAESVIRFTGDFTITKSQDAQV